MNKIKVKDSGSLYRDEDKLKDDVDELKGMMKLILSKLDK